MTRRPGWPTCCWWRLAAVFATPLVWMVLTSFKPPRADRGRSASRAAGRVAIRQLRRRGDHDALSSLPAQFAGAVRRQRAGHVVELSLAAYAFARLKWPFRDQLVRGAGRHDAAALARDDDPPLSAGARAGIVQHAGGAGRADVSGRRVFDLSAAAVLSDDPRGAERGGAARRLQRVGHLLANRPAAVATGAGDGGAVPVHRLVERLQRTAAVPERSQRASRWPTGSSSSSAPTRARRIC